MGGRRQFISLIWLAIALVSSACSFVVQPIETYTSPDGFVRVEYPLEWDVYDTPEDGEYPGVALQSGLPEGFPQSEDAIFPVDALMLVMMVFPPSEPNAPMSLQIAPSVFVRVMSQQVGQGFSSPDEEAFVTEPALVDVGLGVETFQAVAESSMAQVVVYGYRIDEGTVAIAMLVVEPGGNGALQQQAEDVIRTLRLLATPDEIAEHYYSE